MKFKEWMEGESREERRVRDMRALSRSMDAQNHAQNRPATPKGASPAELVSWATKNQEKIRMPMSRFIDMAEDEINIRLAAQRLPQIDVLFFGKQSAKSDSDYERMREILGDSFYDGTSVDQAVEMAMEFMKSQGYLK